MTAKHTLSRHRPSRLIEELWPREVLRAARAPGIVFIPVSPRFEWHGLHLPMGTDGIIAEAMAAELARRFKAVYFRVLPLGLDEVRTRAFKRMQGLPLDAHIFGMNYPTLPLPSEYCTRATLTALLRARLALVRTAGFRWAFVVNHHGGRDQNPTLEELTRMASSDDFGAALLTVSRHCTLRLEGRQAQMLRVGGHAGISETIQLMAVRPELVRTERLPQGRLSAALTGVMHNAPIVPAAYNPRHADARLAARWRRNVLDNMTAAVRTLVATRAGVVK